MGVGVKNNLVQAPLFCSHFVMEFYKERKKCFGHHLMVFPANPHNLLLSGGAGGLCVFACPYVHLRVCSRVCGQNLNPCQDSNPV